MISHVKVKGWGHLADVSVSWKALTLVVGPHNSDLLTLVYSVLDALNPGPNTSARRFRPTKRLLGERLRRNLFEMFQVPKRLSCLTKPGAAGTEIYIRFANGERFACHWGAKAQCRPVITKYPAKWLDGPQVFVPQQDLLSIYPGLVSLYETRAVSFPGIWHRTCVQLGCPDVGLGEEVVNWIEEIFGVRPVLSTHDGMFYLERLKDTAPRLRASNRRIPVVLYDVATRRIFSILRLLRNGQLQSGSTLFWDMPMTGLTPYDRRFVANLANFLTGAGMQVLLATDDAELASLIPRENLTTEAHGG